MIRFPLRLIQSCGLGNRILLPLVLVAALCGVAAIPSRAYANTPPALDPIGNLAAVVGVQVTFTATATDPESPPQTLTFSLDAGPPAGAAITAAGVFTWTPAQTGSVLITVRVTDDGVPTLTDFEMVTVTVGSGGLGPVISASPLAIDFGCVNNGTTSSAQTLTLSNTGDQTLIVSSIMSNDPAFSADVAAVSIDVGASAAVHITFSSFDGLPHFGSLTVSSNASNGSVNISVVGQGNVAPVLGPIGNKTALASTTLTFTITATDVDDTVDDVLGYSMSGFLPGAVLDSNTGAFSWSPSCADAGPHTVTFCVSEGAGCASGPRSDCEAITITVACPVPQPGAIAGSVSANCPAIGTGLFGVTVDVFAGGSGVLVASMATDLNGNFTIAPLPAGDYVVTVVTPLGYATASSEKNVTVVSDGTVSANFALTCVPVITKTRTPCFWEHQVAVALCGKGTAQVSGTTLCSYLDQIQRHYNGNAINQVVVYQPPPSGICADKLQSANSVLNPRGPVAMIARARQQLLALLLNVVAGYISPTRVISMDGATVSQAITYCDNIIDAPGGNVGKAKTIAETINNGVKVSAGMIPLNTVRIAYREGLGGIAFRVTPNPGPGARAFQFMLGTAGPVHLGVYDVSGRMVAELVHGQMGAGAHTASWNGLTAGGRGRASNGIYFARLTTSEGTQTLKIVELRP